MRTGQETGTFQERAVGYDVGSGSIATGRLSVARPAPEIRFGPKTDLIPMP
jgi:hypothetical protein